MPHVEYPLNVDNSVHNPIDNFLITSNNFFWRFHHNFYTSILFKPPKKVIIFFQKFFHTISTNYIQSKYLIYKSLKKVINIINTP